MDQFIYARNLRELVVYQRAFNVSHGIFDLSKGFPEEGKKRTHQSDPASPRVAESHPPLDDEDDEDPLFTDH
jgi:hypothetical protein